MSKYYAVRRGVCPGIYHSWEECEKQIKQVSGAEFRSFKSRSEAQAWLDGLPVQASRIKFYAVRVGAQPGIYDSWEECKEQVNGYAGASYKSFASLKEAESWLAQGFERMKEEAVSDNGEESPSVSYATAYVDGSFNPATLIYGYGGFLVHDQSRYILQGFGSAPEKASMRQVSGEIDGAMAAIRKAIELQSSVLHLYYDYIGIERWASGEWEAKNKTTQAYTEYLASVQGKIEIIFHHIKGHTGDEGNEEADMLAKQAVGVAIKKKKTSRKV